MQTSHVARIGYNWTEALRAVSALMKDPNDVSQVFRIVDALPGHSLARVAERMHKTPAGARLLREQPSLLPLLRDRERLAKMPEDSLGATYLRFCIAENISIDGLVDAGIAAGGTAHKRSQDVDYVWQYLRDTHDLWHVVTEYQGDLLGEPALVAFQAVQTFSPGLSLISVMVFLKGGFLKGIRRIILEGFWRGLRSGWFPGEDWESLLPLPLSEVRRRLRVVKMKPYQPIRISDLPGGKLPT
jgi:ubiquinone biosynthesis protein COQ4